MANPDDLGSETHDWSSSVIIPSIGRDLTGVTLGDFEIERLLGKGGMGEVYLARQLSLNRQIAFKVLRPDLVQNPTYISRFDAEATAAARLSHPNIVHIYSLGMLDGLKYIAMEYVQGTNLKEYLAKKGPLELQLGLSILKQAAQAIGTAGEIGLIHRDIKPENLLLTKKGQVKVADFGLCRDSAEGNKLHLTAPGVTMGTPMYMSPEQVQGHETDHRSDLYSLGVTAYHMLTGQPPFKADSPIAIALKHLKETPISPIVLRGDLPVELDKIILKLMQKDPADRYQSASELLRDIAKLRESMQTQTAMPALETRYQPTTSASTATSTPSFSPSSSLFETISKIPRPRFEVSKSLVFTLALISFLAGGALAWSKRPVDLLGDTAPESSGPAAIWMTPDWRTIEKLGSAEAQYRYAQSKATEDRRAAAWMAVPGYFSSATDWSNKAYTQYARMLLRQRDTERLELLGKELSKHTDRSSDQVLSQIVRGAVAALKHDYQGVVNEFKRDPEVLDAGMVELALEVVTKALRSARLDANSSVHIALFAQFSRFLSSLLRIESNDYPEHLQRQKQSPQVSRLGNQRSVPAWPS